MSLAAIQKKTKLKAPKLILYGGAGIGKSTFGSMLKAPIFLLTEDGLGKIQVDHFPLAGTFDEVIANITSLIEEDHSYKSLVIDSLDWLEPLWQAKYCQDNNLASVEAPGYGKGYVECLKYVRQYLDLLNILRDRGMTILHICHNIVKRVESPEISPYDQNQLKLHAKASALVSEWSDCVFFTNYKLGEVKVKGKGGQMNTKAVAGDRVIYTQDRPAFHAKNRYGLEFEMPFDWNTIREAIIAK